VSPPDLDRHHRCRDPYNSGSEDRIKVDLLAVDTHGYTYSGMSVAKLLKFDLCPQLAGLPDRKIWVPRSIEISDALEKIALPSISEKAIREGWDQTQRFIASINSGRVSVAWTLARHGSAAAGDDVRRFLDQYGRLLHAFRVPVATTSRTTASAARSTPCSTAANLCTCCSGPSTKDGSLPNADGVAMS
jgi:hypothetical protein